MLIHVEIVHMYLKKNCILFHCIESDFTQCQSARSQTSHSVSQREFGLHTVLVSAESDFTQCQSAQSRTSHSVSQRGVRLGKVDFQKIFIKNFEKYTRPQFPRDIQKRKKFSARSHLFHKYLCENESFSKPLFRGPGEFNS